MLNKRLQQQITNKFQRLHYIKLDQDTFQLIVFTDSSFANNKNMLLQIGYVICFVDIASKRNIIYQFFIKCKQVTRSVLAVQLYEKVYRFDIEIVIKATIKKIFRYAILLILYTNSKLFYNCLEKFNNIQEKQLIVYVMSLCQLYKQQMITERK